VRTISRHASCWTTDTQKYANAGLFEVLVVSALTFQPMVGCGSSESPSSSGTSRTSSGASSGTGASGASSGNASESASGTTVSGASGSTPGDLDASPMGSCSAGETHCSTCDGQGFCATSCPAIACPGPSDAGGTDASAPDSGCPADAATSCPDCSGRPFCVSGPCPVISCWDLDASTPACPAATPTIHQACTQLQACPYGSTCAFCAPTNPGLGPFVCGTKGCTWGAMQLAPNPSPCPLSPPKKGASCGNSLSCYYCTPGSLVVASCSSINGTYRWGVVPIAN